jgi:hypothetical protein
MLKSWNNPEKSIRYNVCTAEQPDRTARITHIVEDGQSGGDKRQQ